MRHVFVQRAALLGLLAGSCSSSEPAAEVVVATPAPKVQAAPVAAPLPPLYDAAGNLLGSGEMVAWLEVPRGLTKLPTSAGTFHAYRAQGIPSDRIQAFFGARLIAAKFEKLGASGVRLSGGIPPSGSKPQQSLLDVAVVAGNAPDEVSVQIVEHPYLMPAPKFTTADARNVLKQEQKRAE